jgi:hypothetical protein
MLNQLESLDEGETKVLNFDEHIGVLRDASVQWLWNAYNAVNKPEIVKKVAYNLPSAISYSLNLVIGL